MHDDEIFCSMVFPHNIYVCIVKYTLCALIVDPTLPRNFGKKCMEAPIYKRHKYYSTYLPALKSGCCTEHSISDC